MSGWRVYKATEANIAAPVKMRKKEKVTPLPSIWRVYTGGQVKKVYRWHTKGYFLRSASAPKQGQGLVNSGLVVFTEILQAGQRFAQLGFIGHLESVKANAV